MIGLVEGVVCSVKTPESGCAKYRPHYARSGKLPSRRKVPIVRAKDQKASASP